MDILRSLALIVVTVVLRYYVCCIELHAICVLLCLRNKKPRGVPRVVAVRVNQCSIVFLGVRRLDSHYSNMTSIIYEMLLQ